LRGRAGRQGDPGSSLFYVSLEDDLMRLFGSDRIAGIMDRFGYKEGEVIQHSMITKSIERAQKKIEENNYGIRKRLLEYDDVMNAQREVIYRKRRHALFGDRLSYDLNNMLFDLGDEVIGQYAGTDEYDAFKLDVIRFFSTDTKITAEELKSDKPANLTHRLFEETNAVYQRKMQQLAANVFPVIKDLYETRGETIENIVIPFTDGIKGIQVVCNLKKSFESHGKEVAHAFEKGISLSIIDEAWKDHLREMDELKQAVQGAVYEQKDPLLIYKFEAFGLFKKMLGEVNKDVVSFLCKATLPEQHGQQRVNQAQKTERTDYSRMREGRGAEMAAPAMNGDGQQNPEQDEQKKLEPIRVGPKVGRNDPCPCGSGKKYKNCHGKEA
jgi:preprotein translocase subunit SecA